MKLDNRRMSDNVEDRRSGGSAAKIGGGLGLGGVVVALLIAFMTGQDPVEVVSSVIQNESAVQTSEGYTPTEEEEQLAIFSRKILAGTEDVWTQVFAKMGKEYESPTLVLFTSAVQSGCGNASSQTGPFYCSSDQKLYIDLSFFSSMKESLGADGDFAYAYVIAHEVGHHVQNLLGTLGQAHSQMARMSETESNKMSVRIELQADFLAGVWGYYDDKMFDSLEDGDIEEAVNCASVIGDDYLEKKAYGYEMPETFNHGRSEWRMRWLKKGLTTGDLSQGDTFSVKYGDF